VPRGITSAAVVFDSADDARRGLGLRDELISFVAGESPRDFSDIDGLGDEAIAFRNGGYDVPPGAGVIWRNGNMLAVVFAGGIGLGRERAPGVAVGLARKQQARIEHPKPPRNTDDDERQLQLDNPELDVPVYWLGTRFDPSGALPALKLYKGRAYPGGGRPEIGFEVELDYERGVRIHLWKPAAWQRAKHGLPGRLVLADGCTRATPVAIEGGKAVIYAGYAKPSQPPCPERPPDLFFANATLDDVVVRINAPLCFYPCSQRVGKDPYNSAAGMEAVLRGLRLRR
jgi:hypothetical protein